MTKIEKLNIFSFTLCIYFLQKLINLFPTSCLKFIKDYFKKKFKTIAQKLIEDIDFK